MFKLLTSTMRNSPMPRLLASFAITALLCACAVRPDAGILAPDGATIDLGPGQIARLSNGGAIRYVRLVNDSRCPPDVQCVWAGDAVVALHWAPATGTSRELQLHLNAAAGSNHADLDGRRVALAALSQKGEHASLLVTAVP